MVSSGAADVTDDEDDGFGPATGNDSAGSSVSGAVAAPRVVASPQNPQTRVRLADRSLRQTNPLLGVVVEFLDSEDLEDR
jgi:hypothetical protein